MKRFARFGGLVLWLIASGRGLAEPPVIKQISPAAIASGTASEVNFLGSHLSGATNLWTSFEAKIEHVRSTDESAVFKISLPCATGVGAVRLTGSNGVSSLRLVCIDPLPTMPASQSNHSASAAQELKPSVGVEGACEERASDFFRFSARKNERLSFEVIAQRVGSSLDPLVRLLDLTGRELLFCEDTPGAGVDCRFTYKFSKAGQYLLELRDTRYDGGSQFRYRLRFGSFPIEPGPLPFLARPEFGKPLSVLPTMAEVEPNDSKAQNVAVPACILGRFAKPKDRDCFQFQAGKGERLVFRSRTRSLGSPCDLYLRLETADGKKLGDSPMTGPEESSLTNTFKEPGTYQLVVEEAAELGGPEFFYRLEIEPFRPGFNLNAETETIQGRSGGTAEIKVSPERHGYDGPIALALEGPVAGFELEPNTITGKTNITTVKIRLPSRLEPGSTVNFKIKGSATVDGKEFACTASTRPALRKLFPHLPWPPPELDGWIALGVMPKP